MHKKNVKILIDHIGYIRKYNSIKLFVFKIKLLAESLSAWTCCNFFKVNVIKEKIDVLVLARSVSSYTYNNFSSILRDEINYKIEIQQKNSSIIRTKQFLTPPSSKSLYLFIYQAYAAYLIEKYSPKLIITESNGSIFSSVLKDQCSLSGVKVLHIAHSVTTMNYRAFSLIDYDYYIIFGRSSINYINNRPRLLGNCEYLICGSWVIQDRLSCLSDINFEAFDSEVYLLLGSGPSYESKPETKMYYDLIIKFIIESGAILIFKPHPRSDLGLWRTLTAGKSESNFLIANNLSNDMQGYIKIAFCGYTNAILDISSLKIVPILIADNISEDLFEYQKYFGKPVSSPESLKDKICLILDNYTYFSQKTIAFSEYHLSTIKDSKEFILNQIKKLLLMVNTTSTK